MAIMFQFPDRPSRRREAARRPRRSKNGTPEERAAKAGPAIERPRKQRRSKNGTPAERAAKMQSAKVVHIGPGRDLRALPPPMTTEEFADAISRMNERQLQALKDAVEETVRQPPGSAA